MSTGLGFFFLSSNFFFSAFFKPFFASFCDSVLSSLFKTDLSFGCNLRIEGFLLLFVELSSLSLKHIKIHLAVVSVYLELFFETCSIF